MIKKEDKGLVAKILNCSLDEVEMHMEQAKQRLLEYAHKLEECKKLGHPNAVADHMYCFYGRIMTHIQCPMCGGYERNPTQEEYDDFWRKMREPVTI